MFCAFVWMCAVLHKNKLKTFNELKNKWNPGSSLVEYMKPPHSSPPLGTLSILCNNGIFSALGCECFCEICSWALTAASVPWEASFQFDSGRLGGFSDASCRPFWKWAGLLTDSCQGLARCLRTSWDSHWFSDLRSHRRKCRATTGTQTLLQHLCSLHLLD